MKIDLSVNVGGLELKNPVLTASGTFGYGDESADLVPVKKLGGIVTKTITLRPKPGNPPPRLAEVKGGILNAIGLQNMGADRFVSERLPALSRLGTKVIVSVAGETAEDYAGAAARLAGKAGVDAVELNLSCPNLKKRLVCFDTALVADIISRVKKAVPVPVFAKLSPHIEDIAATAELCREAGADAVTLVNTFTGMAVDCKTWRPKLANVTGGMSGPAIKPLALRCVWEVCGKVRIPVIACGGIATAEDAVEFLLAGASAVTVGTANFTDIMSPVKIVRGLEKYLKGRKLSSVNEIIGKIKAGA